MLNGIQLIPIFPVDQVCQPSTQLSLGFSRTVSPSRLTMPSSRQLLAALAAAAVPAVEGAMGPAFSTGPVASNSFIREATSTLILPKAPTGSTGDLSLWVGMGTSKGDLIQSIADNWSSSNWTIFAYTLLSTSATTQMPVQSDSTTAYPGDQITMHCESIIASQLSTKTCLV